MNWNDLTSQEQLSNIIKESFEKPQLIFKHSTSCPISAVVKSRFEGDWKRNELMGTDQLFLLDLLSFRALSNQIASEFDVRHESPQLLVIYQGKAVFHASHTAISAQILADFLVK